MKNIRQYKSNKIHLDTRPIFGLPANFYVLVGGRGIGKTYTCQKYALRQFFKHGKKFIWLRLKEPAVKTLLANNAKDFIDSGLILKWKITGFKVEGNSVLVTRGDPEDKSSYREMCKILALSTFYQIKGVALNKGGKTPDIKLDDKMANTMIKSAIKKFSILILDEMNAEKMEKKTFDIAYAFMNQIETICRNDRDRRIILTGNTLDEASDILATSFRFIPDEFGIYRIRIGKKKKGKERIKAVIAYIPNSKKFDEEREQSLAAALAPEASTLTNKIQSDVELISKRKPGPMSFIIQFDDNTKFVACGNIITKQQIPKNINLPVIAMRRWLTGIPYYEENAKLVMLNAEQRRYQFDRLMTLKLFYKELKLLKV